MDLFERVMQTGRGHQREIRDVLGLGYGGVPGRETTPTVGHPYLPMGMTRKTLRSVSNIRQHKEYLIIPELSATLTALQRNPSFNANSDFHIL